MHEPSCALVLVLTGERATIRTEQGEETKEKGVLVS